MGLLIFVGNVGTLHLLKMVFSKIGSKRNVFFGALCLLLLCKTMILIVLSAFAELGVL